MTSGDDVAASIVASSSLGGMVSASAPGISFADEPSGAPELPRCLGRRRLLRFANFRTLPRRAFWLGVLTSILSFLSGLFFAMAIAFWPKPSSVRKPAGTHLRTLAVFLWSKKSFERVFEPIIVDMRLEYHEALVANEIWHARWIWIRGHIQFWIAAVGHVFVLILRLVQKIWVASG
jgi:hypothetical protein